MVEVNIMCQPFLERGSGREGAAVLTGPLIPGARTVFV